MKGKEANIEFDEMKEKKPNRFRNLSKKRKIILLVVGITIIILSIVLALVLTRDKNGKDMDNDSKIKYKSLTTEEYQKRVDEYGSEVTDLVLKYYEKHNIYPYPEEIIDEVTIKDMDCDVSIQKSYGIRVSNCYIKGYVIDEYIEYEYLFDNQEDDDDIDYRDGGPIKINKKAIKDGLKDDGKDYNANGEYKINGNNLNDFDLYFLKRSNNKSNVVYSPLAAKYALSMLYDGSDGDTKTQLENVLGNYTVKKYTNNKNMALANALFIKNDFRDQIRSEYISKIQSKYDAEVKFDSFTKPDVVNNYVSEKTFDLIKNITDDISRLDFILLNTVAIDMEWVNTIKPTQGDYFVEFEHEVFKTKICSLGLCDYDDMKFENMTEQVPIADFAAVANKYDIVKILGEENIRKTITEDYRKWLKENPCDLSKEELAQEKPVKQYVDDYIKDINKGYKHISSSTDFKFYDDNEVKVFAKELKKYNGVTLEYIGIMPKNKTLSEYINNINSDSLNEIIKNLKPIELSSFEEGYITEITGKVPFFGFDYDMDLINYFKGLGIKDVFDIDKSNLSKLTSGKAYINSVKQSTTIEFSNEGIKAASAIITGGAGDAGCWYDYKYEVPIKKIDLTFNKPYIFIIRDTSSNEVWFAGSVYEPVTFE